MRVRVDQRLCEAHALCVEIAPTVFDVGVDLTTCDPAPDESLRVSVEAAAAACPRQAISVVFEEPAHDWPALSPSLFGPGKDFDS
ncbi:MAG: ferredoxin [Mycobacterium sp.]